jgi:hypothetical protein
LRRILKAVRAALQEELTDFLEIRGTWPIYYCIHEGLGVAKLALVCSIPPTATVLVYITIMASLEIPHQISPGAEKFEMAKAKPRQHKCGFRLGVLRHYLGISSPEDTNASRRYFSSALLSGAETFKDPVFVSLDTEGHNRGCIRKIGLSIFDKRNLKNLNSTSGLSKILASYNYILYKDVKAEQDRHFKFGTSKRMDGRWTHWLFEKVLRTRSPDLVPPIRQYKPFINGSSH